jgi:hypothetical protein
MDKSFQGSVLPFHCLDLRLACFPICSSIHPIFSLLMQQVDLAAQQTGLGPNVSSNDD